MGPAAGTRVAHARWERSPAQAPCAWGEGTQPWESESPQGPIRTSLFSLGEPRESMGEKSHLWEPVTPAWTSGSCGVRVHMT